MSNLLQIIKLSLVVASSLSVISAVAMAEDLPDRGPIPFTSYDINKDGSVSESEFYDTRATRMSNKASQNMPMRNAENAPDFNTLDRDNDGKLTKLELLEGQNQQMQNNRANKRQGQKGQRRKMQDMNRNMPIFESYDLNRDGYLTENEMSQARAKRIEQKVSQGKLLRNSANQTKFANIDTNNDGKVSKQEFITNQTKKR
ncbi:EF-hand domain-containing protein [Sulfurimonas aquatica]|nr:EF-hand domain-containing protein [Sulfurimonas aquatica]